MAGTIYGRERLHRKVTAAANNNMYLNSADDRIKWLERELDDAQQGILSMSGVALDFRGFYRCKDREDFAKWERALVEAALEAAKPVDGTGIDQLSQYAFCPMCRGGVDDFYSGERGFKFPIGLERHIEGWGSRPACLVYRAATGNARRYLREQFLKQDEQAKMEARAMQVARMASEDVYQVDPRRDPELLDADSRSWQPARNPDGDEQFGLKWAVQRLEVLGLKQLQVPKQSGAGSVVSFVDEHPDYAVYGDPRSLGKVTFVVVKLKNGKPSSGRRSASSVPRFELQDRWKNDLRKKYIEQVGLALVSLGLKSTP